MEEIIGILVFVVLAIVKIIDKKFNSASAKPAPGAETHEVFPEIEVEETERPVYRQERMYPEFQRPEPIQPEPIQPEPIQPVRKMPEHFAGQPVVKPVDKPVARPAAKPSAKKNTESFLKEEPLKTREKIDPKKLIVYSEIMNRKY